MKYLFQSIPFLVLLFLASCQNDSPRITETEVIQLEFQNDLIPEGIAVDEKTGKIFLSSVPMKKIVQCDLNGNDPSNFIERDEYHFKSGLGMETFDGKLFAIGSNDETLDKSSILLVLNSDDGSLLDTFTWEDADSTNHFFNDLAISSKGEVYITNSHGNSIFKLNYPDGKIEKFITSDDFNYANGIAISQNEKYLYVTTWEKGIRIIDLATKKIINSTSEISSGIDGLKFYKNNLIGVYNGNADKTKHEIVRFLMDKSGSKILGKETVFSANEHFDIPTTFDISDNVLYFISNTQLDRFLGEEGINDYDNLKPYTLIRHPLK
ncbi:MAG: SMP-30/gluconolactonase/LRE family protein [Saprospiraceae bacterium]